MAMWLARDEPKYLADKSGSNAETRPQIVIVGAQDRLLWLHSLLIWSYNLKRTILQTGLVQKVHVMGNLCVAAIAV